MLAPFEYARDAILNCGIGSHHNCERAEVDGVTYLVSGGRRSAILTKWSGRHSTNIRRQNFPNFHYILFHLDGRELKATMYRLGYPMGDKLEW